VSTDFEVPYFVVISSFCYFVAVRSTYSLCTLLSNTVSMGAAVIVRDQVEGVELEQPPVWLC